MKTKAGFFFGILLLLFFLSYFILFVVTPETQRLLTSEDHLYENIQALGNLVASIVFFIIFLKNKSGNNFYGIRVRKNLFYLLLAILFFFGFGEEISWGQRIFDWQIPELAKINVQGETNIHNIGTFHMNKLINFNRLYSIFWFSFCFLIPVLDKSIIGFSKWIRRINLPIVPIWMGALFPLNYLVYRIIESYFASSLWWQQSEVKETVFAILFAAYSIWSLTEIQKKCWDHLSDCQDEE